MAQALYRPRKEKTKLPQNQGFYSQAQCPTCPSSLPRVNPAIYACSKSQSLRQPPYQIQGGHSSQNPMPKPPTRALPELWLTQAIRVPEWGLGKRGVKLRCTARDRESVSYQGHADWWQILDWRAGLLTPSIFGRPTRQTDRQTAHRLNHIPNR